MDKLATRSKILCQWFNPLITPKFIKSQWFTNHRFTIPTLLAEQGVKIFVEM